MYVTIRNSRVFFSDGIIQRERLKSGDFIFLFKMKGKDEFGFHKADADFNKVVPCAEVKKDRLSGELYIQPQTPPAGLITAVFRMSKNDESKLPVKVLSYDNLVVQQPMYKINKE